MKNVKKIADSLKISPWEKADFDENGYLDILVVGKIGKQYSVICLFGKPDNKYELKSISQSDFYYGTLPVMQNFTTKPTFDYYYFKSDYDSSNLYPKSTLHKSTLVYEFGTFIEKNDQPYVHKIEQIEFSTSGCGGLCPVYKVVINSDKSATWLWDSNYYNVVNKKVVNGNYGTKLISYNLSYLTQVLNYIDFARLKNIYAVPWTDDKSCEIKITYDNGKIKKISDYGMVGTFGLERVYKLLFDLWRTQEWHIIY
ncbi:MAG: DUF6438 domain-containing protein [Ferruginibacter sp.]